jgi:ABC-type molybdate transport system substrate-binding protein
VILKLSKDKVSVKSFISYLNSERAKEIIHSYGYLTD